MDGIVNWWAFTFDFNQMTFTKDENLKVLIYATQYTIWKARTDVIFKGKKMSPTAIIIKARTMMVEFLPAHVYKSPRMGG